MVEQEYFQEWERTTAISEDYVDRQPTVLSTLASLPNVVKYYIIPGPLRFVWYWIWKGLLHALRQLQRALVLQGASRRAVRACALAWRSRAATQLRTSVACMDMLLRAQQQQLQGRLH